MKITTHRISPTSYMIQCDGQVVGRIDRNDESKLYSLYMGTWEEGAYRWGRGEKSELIECFHGEWDTSRLRLVSRAATIIGFARKKASGVS